jgi:peptide/nickel transport system ATP-binding protein
MLVSVRDLHVSFRLGRHKVAEAVRGVSFDVPENRAVALVGESGSGKSVSALSIVRLLPENAIVGPRSAVEYQGRNLLREHPAHLRALRGRDFSMVFQEPMSSLNPRQGELRRRAMLARGQRFHLLGKGEVFLQCLALETRVC